MKSPKKSGKTVAAIIAAVLTLVDLGVLFLRNQPALNIFTLGIMAIIVLLWICWQTAFYSHKVVSSETQGKREMMFAPAKPVIRFQQFRKVIPWIGYACSCLLTVGLLVAIIPMHAPTACEFTNRGIAYFTDGQFDLSIIDYTIAIKINPNCGGAYLDRGLTYDKLKEYNSAIADYTKAIEIDPSNKVAYTYRGSAYSAEGKNDLAMADYNKAIGLNSSYADAYIWQGIAYNSQGNFDMAIAEYTEAIEINPGNTMAYGNRGNEYADEGKYDLAIIDYTRSISIDPKYRNAYLGLADTYKAQG